MLDINPFGIMSTEDICSIYLKWKTKDLNSSTYS